MHVPLYCFIPVYWYDVIVVQYSHQCRFCCLSVRVLLMPKCRFLYNHHHNDILALLYTWSQCRFCARCIAVIYNHLRGAVYHNSSYQVPVSVTGCRTAVDSLYVGGLLLAREPTTCLRCRHQKSFSRFRSFFFLSFFSLLPSFFRRSLSRPFLFVSLCQ